MINELALLPEQHRTRGAERGALLCKTRSRPPASNGSRRLRTGPRSTRRIAYAVVDLPQLWAQRRRKTRLA